MFHHSYKDIFSDFRHQCRRIVQNAVRGTCIYLASVAIRHQYRRKVKSIAKYIRLLIITIKIYLVLSTINVEGSWKTVSLGHANSHRFFSFVIPRPRGPDPYFPGFDRPNLKRPFYERKVPELTVFGYLTTKGSFQHLHGGLFYSILAYFYVF